MKSKCLLVSALLGTLYAIYIISHFFGGVASTDGAEQVGAAIATALVLPHIITLVLAIIFNWVAFAANIKGMAIATGILYSVSGVIFILYFLFLVPMIVLSFIGVSKISKIKKGATT